MIKKLFVIGIIILFLSLLSISAISISSNFVDKGSSVIHKTPIKNVKVDGKFAGKIDIIKNVNEKRSFDIFGYFGGGYVEGIRRKFTGIIYKYDMTEKV